MGPSACSAYPGLCDDLGNNMRPALRLFHPCTSSMPLLLGLPPRPLRPQVLKMAGEANKRVVFLFADTQIKEEGFVEDISNLLNTYEVREGQRMGL